MKMAPHTVRETLLQTRVLRTHTRCAVIVCAVSYYNSIKLIMSVCVREQLQSAKHTYNEPGRDVTWTAMH